MDLYYPRCGEPWDMDYVLHEMDVIERADFKAGRGCPSCKGKEVKKRPFRAEIAAALSDALGDDIDGLATEMEDAEAMLGSKFWE